MQRDYSILSDEILVDLIREHDEKAFAVIYKRYSAPLYTHAYDFLRNREDTRDILQKVFIKIWDIREQLPHDVNLSSYLYQTVKNVLINHIAHSKIVDKYLDSLSIYSKNYVADTDYHIREKQLQEIIENEICQLPPKMRTVFELSRNQHMTHKQIAEELGISEKTVKNQITSALKVLRSKLPLVLFLLTLFPDKHHF